MYTSTVGVNLYRFGQQATGDLFRQRATQPGGINTADHALTDVLNQRSMAIAQRAGGQRQIFKAHTGDGIHHQINGQIATAKSVVERDGHAIL
ncbi:hypothetical protein SDC9_210098 [bioreactor metagenome]|uniref:Uncharacterized protein n=1 Tax=bioreactor metagenome TaxID=1076179 RepID=A0A645JFG9_9ZZZZ